VNGSITFPQGFHLEALHRTHARRSFDCGQADVNAWVRTKALQHQDKRLSATKVLVDGNLAIAGLYTLATGQVDFGDLPVDLVRKLPRRTLPVAIVAWLGVRRNHQGKKLGDLLFAQALRDCYQAGQSFAFVAVILDCIDDRAQAFYQRWDFAELPGNPYRLFLSSQTLTAMMNSAS
jgi:GNAT superfamily N-acetyltransferase